jgi:hypothetical protein
MVELDITNLDFVWECLDDIVDRLEDYLDAHVDEDVDYQEIGLEITEAENANGSWYCNEADLKREVTNQFWFFKEFCNDFCEIEYLRWNAVFETEVWHCAVMIELYDFLLRKLIEEIDYDEKKSSLWDIDYIRNYVKNYLAYSTIRIWFNS